MKNFFEHQEQARKRTGWLIVAFAAAVIGIILTTHFLLVGALTFASFDRASATQHLIWNPGIFFMISGFTLLVVGGGSLWKTAQLAAGGSVVAEDLGGRPISPDTRDPLERKVLNVVEEMAIASGMPVPTVYLMKEEKGINAFAAGFTPQDAVIGVTQGAIEQLTRAELQGVMAHEFSHIFNGDMRLNIRLMGVIHGIILLSLIGYMIMRGSVFSRDRNSGGAVIAGFGLWILGSIGMFFGNLIKAAVSRQREFLADASAVQFTRNPDGIGNALKRIAGYKVGSKVRNPNAPEASHMFFGQAFRQGFFDWFATHPPIDERIRRIDPSWNAELAQPLPKAPVDEPSPVAMGFAATGQAVAEPPLQTLGAPSPAHVAYAAELIEGLPKNVVDGAREPYGARAVIYALLLDRDAGVRHNQLQHLSRHADAAVYQETTKLMTAVDSISVESRIAVVDLSLPALRLLTHEQYQAFRRNVEVLVEADQRISLFEWTLQRILLRHIEPHFGRMKPSTVQYKGWAPVKDEVELLIASLAYIGHPQAVDAKQAFYKAVQSLGFVPGRMPGPEGLGFALLDEALSKVDALAPRLKQQFLQACEICIWNNEKVSREEAEMLRAMADAIACPMPPILRR